jgi:hypothetical protein
MSAHQTHRCLKHGCKYYPCEWCEDPSDAERIVAWLRAEAEKLEKTPARIGEAIHNGVRASYMREFADQIEKGAWL